MLKIDSLSFSYTQKHLVLKDFQFSLQKGEHLCVMGESGCGKSTLLKIIYGLLDATKGHLFWNDIEILGPKHHLVPGMDFIKYVAQDFDLMPYTSVAENISKFLSRFYPEEMEKRTQELLEVIEMTAFANTKVQYLSGGQQQRVAIARALANEPELLLLDEPFSQIDNFKKNAFRRNLFAYLKKQDIACMVATHDGKEALSFADTVLVIKDNRIAEIGCPKTVYKAKKNKYIAALFDDVNELFVNNKRVLLYPHEIQLVAQSDYKALVKHSYFNGFYWLLALDFEQQVLFVKHDCAIQTGSAVCFNF